MGINGIIQSVPGGLLIISDALRHHWGVQFFPPFWSLTWPVSFLIPRRMLRTPFEAPPRRIQVCSAACAAAITVLWQSCLGCRCRIAFAELLGFSDRIAFVVLPWLQLSHCFCSVALVAAIALLLQCCIWCSNLIAFAVLPWLQLSQCFCSAALALAITVPLQSCLGCSYRSAFAVLPGRQPSHCFCSAAWVAATTLRLHCCLGLQLPQRFCSAAWAAAVALLLQCCLGCNHHSAFASLPGLQLP